MGFFREVLGEDPWEKQIEIAEAVRDNALTTVRGCHASGKDWGAGRLDLWWVYARDGLVVLTGPTSEQVEEIYMRKEIREPFEREQLPGDLYVRALRTPRGWKGRIQVRTATAASKIQGIHGVKTLFVITEAQDPDLEHAWDACFRVATGEEDHALTLGNPERPSGSFYDANQPSSDWEAIQIAASDVPNVREGDRVIPGLLSQQAVERFASRYGTSSREYRVRVRGEFPARAKNGLYRREWLDAAVERELEPGEPEVLAVDPSRFGPDRSVLVHRRGPVTVAIKVWEDRVSTTTLVRRVEEYIQSLREEPPYRDDPAIVFDGSGLGGPVGDLFHDKGYRVAEFKGGRSARRETSYANRRAEAYSTFREKLEGGEVDFPAGEELIEELLEVRWRLNPKEQVRLEAKTELRRRLRRSPDRADAVVMAFDHVPQPSPAMV